MVDATYKRELSAGERKDRSLKSFAEKNFQWDTSSIWLTCDKLSRINIYKCCYMCITLALAFCIAMKLCTLNTQSGSLQYEGNPLFKKT